MSSKQERQSEFLENLRENETSVRNFSYKRVPDAWNNY